MHVSNVMTSSLANETFLKRILIFLRESTPRSFRLYFLRLFPALLSSAWPFLLLSISLSVHLAVYLSISSFLFVLQTWARVLRRRSPARWKNPQVWFESKESLRRSQMMSESFFYLYCVYDSETKTRKERVGFLRVNLFASHRDVLHFHPELWVEKKKKTLLKLMLLRVNQK